MTAAAVRERAQRAQKVQPVKLPEEQEAAPGPLPLDLHRLAHRKAPPREWTIDQWKPRNAPILVAGTGGSGKSLLVQQVATAEALRRDFIGCIARQSRVLFWNCEDDEDELWRRQEAISEHFGVELDAPAGLSVVSRFKRENVLMGPARGVLATTAAYRELREQVNDLCIDSLWLDNVAHVFAGNHDDRGEVTLFVNTVCGLVLDRPLDVGLVAHTSRQQGSEFSGSAAWENACRARWFFGSKLPDQREKDADEATDPTVRYLARRKSNYSAQDHMRMTYSGGAFVPDQPVGRVGGLMRALGEQKADELVVAGFRSLRGMGIAATDGKNSPDYLPRQMVAKGLGAGYTEAELGRAMNRLMARGAFTRGAVGAYANRTPRMGLVLATEQR